LLIQESILTFRPFQSSSFVTFFHLRQHRYKRGMWSPDIFCELFPNPSQLTKPETAFEPAEEFSEARETKRCQLGHREIWHSRERQSAPDVVSVVDPTIGLEEYGEPGTVL
jgi:hypothetical protein